MAFALLDDTIDEILTDTFREKDRQIKTGHWIRCDILQEFKCSECRVCFRNKSSFCPNCGARMELKGSE